MWKRAWFVFWIVATHATLLAAESAPRFPSAETLAAFEAQVRHQMQFDRTTGLSLAFQIGDSIWARGFGFADVENQVPASPHSSYRTASITKPMTACAVLQLVEQGKIDLDADVRTYVPGFPEKPFPVTVRQLLGHLGGIPHYVNRDVELHIKDHKTTEQSLAIFNDYDLVAEPGTRYSYSTYGYCLLGAAIESVSGRPYGDYMRERIWGPLGMQATRMDDPTALVPNRVRGYRLVRNEVANSEFVDISSRFAGGGTRTTVLDLLAFARGFQAGKIVSAASIERMTEPGSTRDGRATYYGLGWDLFPINGHYMTSHSGGQNETRTLLFSLPRRHCAIALASNFEGINIALYARRFAQVVLDELWDTTGGTAAYVGDAVSAGRLTNMRLAFNHGLYQFEKLGPWTGDEETVRRAFVYFKACMERKALTSNRAATLEKIEAGRWPANGEASVIVGWFMATQLAAHGGADALQSYHQSGAVPFFSDYAVLARAHAKLPQELRFGREIENLLERWNKDWERTSTPEVRHVVVAPFSDLTALEATLKPVFARASIYPDWSEAFAQTSAQLLTAGKPDVALRAATVSHALYPESAEANKWLALAELCTGDAKRAEARLRKAVDAGDPDVASAGVFRGQAYDLHHLGHTGAGIELLRITALIYPKEALVHDAMGDLYADEGRRAEAIAAYRRALEITPTLDATRDALAKLEAEARAE